MKFSRVFRDPKVLHRLIRRLTTGALCLLPLAARCETGPGHGPRDATVFILRHAEKPDDGDGLTATGQAHADAYAGYFRNLKLQSRSATPDVIFAAADSKNSRRSRLTVEPLARSLGLAVNTAFRDEEYPLLAAELQARYGGRRVLVCWHHGTLPRLLRAMDADPDTLLPGGKWPPDEYRWVILLRYGADGKLQTAQRLDPGLTGSR